MSGSLPRSLMRHCHQSSPSQLDLRPGELRKLTWDLVDLHGGVIHVWRSASRSGGTQTPQSKRSLVLPKRAITALKAHEEIQDRERAVAGESWQETQPGVRLDHERQRRNHRADRRRRWPPLDDQHPEALPHQLKPLISTGATAMSSTSETRKTPS